MINKNNYFVLSHGYLHALLLSTALFFSQFYTWSSGLPQISHIFMTISILMYILLYRFIKISDSQYLLLFLSYSLLVNLAWYLLDNFNTSYLISSIYWIFNYLFFITFTNISTNHINKLFKLILKTITLSYILEIAIWTLNLGRYDFNPRYNGLFNDPNQMAFWILSTCAIYIYLSTNRIKTVFVFAMGLFLILTTLSRSGMLGYIFLTLALVIRQPGSLKKKALLSTFFIALLLIALVVLNHYGFFDSIINRFVSGLAEKESQAEGRGFDVITNNAEMLIIGAGQGNYSRFIPSGNEIHSTWLGIPFYYGLVGASLFFIFLYKIYTRISLADKVIFLSPILYGFFTYSARTTIFWCFLSIFTLALKSKLTKNET